MSYSPESLRFRSDGTFTIAQFTDTHWHNGEPADEQSAALMAAALDAESPDLVALTGDVIDGEYCADPAASWRAAVAPIVERGLPWAAVFGNHDDEGALDRSELMRVQQSIPGCLSQPGAAGVSGVGNYVLQVRSAGSLRPAATLYFLDSNSYAEPVHGGDGPPHEQAGIDNGAPPGPGGYGWIRRDQIAWYLDAAQTVRAAAGGETPLPALAFFHIPLPEYDEVWDLHVCYGEKHELVCCPHINTGFFAALHEAGDVLGTFVGHDHINDFTGELHGIRLCYGRGSGFNTYGKSGFARGARIIRLREGVRAFETWLRLEGNVRVDLQPRHDPELERRV